MSKLETHQGGCLCGAVRYTVTGPLREPIGCHCEQCRRTSGHYVVASACEDTDLTLDREEGLAWYRSSETAKRGFCTLCGSSLFWKSASRASTSLMAGTLDVPTGTHMSHHIFVADKSDYYSVRDGLPQAQQDEAPTIPSFSDPTGDQ